jgi:hypothetical protein
MKPLYCTIAEAFRYHRSTLEETEIQDALDDYAHLQDIIYDADVEPKDLVQELDQLRAFKEDNEGAEEALRFVDDIKRVYEDRFGDILDTQLDTLVQLIHDALQQVPDENA